MKKKLIFYLSLIFVTALLVKAAYIWRGYFAFGGEWLAWIFPLLIQAVMQDEKSVRLEG